MKNADLSALDNFFRYYRPPLPGGGGYPSNGKFPCLGFLKPPLSDDEETGVSGIWWLFVGENKISEMHVKVGTYFDVGRVTMLV